MSTKGNRELIGLGLIMGGVLVALVVAYVRNVHDSVKQNASISERIELVQALRLALAATSEAQNSAVMANREHDSKSFVEEARMENAAFDRGRVKLAELVKQRADKNEVGLIEKVDETFREFQLLLLPHIAESSDQKMDDLEAQIAEEDRGIRKNLESLTKLLQTLTGHICLHYRQLVCLCPGS